MDEIHQSAGNDLTHRVRERVAAFNGSPFARLMGMEITEVWPRGARVTMAPEGKENPHGVIHGGAIFSLADQAFAIAANQEEMQVATSVYITFMAPATGPLEAVAEFLGETDRTALYRVTVRAGERLVASFDGVTFRK
ncbi:MAG: PaaI family thioesterase [Methanomicrobiales archaeon]|nr:PaaI family thioesterase [Methanomicrobiales archaeon]